MPIKKKKLAAKTKTPVVAAPAIDFTVVPVSSPILPLNRFLLSLVPVMMRFGLAILLVIASLSFYQLAFAQRIYPGVFVGEISLAGRTVAEAEALLTVAWNNFTSQGITLKVDEKSVILTSLVTSPADPDLTYELLRFSPQKTANQAYVLGRSGSWVARLFDPVFISLAFNKSSQVPVEIEIERVLQYIRDSFSNLEQTPQPAQLVIDLTGNISVQPEAKGLIIDSAHLVSDLNQRLSELDLSPVEVKFIAVTPDLNQALVASLLPEARELLVDKDKDLIFSYSNKKWEAPATVWHQWLGVELNEQTKQAKLGMISEKAEEFFTPIEQAVNQPASDAKFEIRNGRVVVFRGSAQGRTIDRGATLTEAFNVLTANINEPVTLIVATTDPNIITAEVNNLGISEIIGIGYSNFKGSPPNRRHNIKVGADALNGLLIKPGEEFSLLKALLPVDAAAGYLPELVIKGNRTIPEYGGGLCQIGTTIFRAALDSGLPITARRNHSYRVVYYEPAGTDATIYDPAPDFKFRNDTGNTVLIQTRIEGDDIYFDFWGRPDGRQVVQTKPRIYNIVSPPSTRIIQTEDLEPGVKKCTERPHNGADAEFTYTVTYASGEAKEQVFKSHYIPWQEVCLVGVPKGTLNPPETETELGNSEPENS